MLSTKRHSSKVSRISKVHHRRHRSIRNYPHELSKVDTPSTGIIHVTIGMPRRPSSIKTDQIPFTTTKHHPHSRKKLSKRSTIATTESVPLNNVSRVISTDQQKNSDDADSSKVNGPSSSRIDSDFNPKSISSHLNQDQVFDEEKQPKIRKKSRAYYYLCTPLRGILTVLAGLLVAIVIATILIAVLVKNKSSTTPVTPAETAPITSTSSAISSPTSSISSTSSTTSSTTSSDSTTSSTSSSTSSTSSISSTTSSTSSTSSSTSTSSTTSSTTLSTTSTSTTTTMACYPSCLYQSWISSSDLLAQWTFDGTYLDQTNTYNATPVNSPSFYASGYVNQALTLSQSSSQYVYTSYIPLINASFTIELWLYPTSYPNPTDQSILGLCTNLSSDRCLHTTIRNFAGTRRLYMSFFGDNCSSNATVLVNQWTHAAFVFDLTTLTMSIYQNGVLVGNCIAVFPLQGNANNVTIGYIPGIVAAYGTNYFQGYFDQLIIYNRAKPACEILEDATLATYYNFDNSSAIMDDGPNSLSSVSQSVNFTSSGQSSGAISFNGNTSYFQILDFVGLGVSNQAFSISLWIRPYALGGSVIYVENATISSYWCMPFIGFSSSSTLVAQIWNGGSVRSIYGPTLLTLSVWHHVVQTWSSTNGLRLYVDNVLVASNTTVTPYAASGISDNIKLANRPNNACAGGSIGPQLAFHGDIDEFRVYTRELAADDVCALYFY